MSAAARHDESTLVFQTLDTAPLPHVRLFYTACSRGCCPERLVATIPIVQGRVDEAEAYARLFIQAIDEEAERG